MFQPFVSLGSSLLRLSTESMIVFMRYSDQQQKYLLSITGGSFLQDRSNPGSDSFYNVNYYKSAKHFSLVCSHRDLAKPYF